MHMLYVWSVNLVQVPFMLWYFLHSKISQSHQFHFILIYSSVMPFPMFCDLIVLIDIIYNSTQFLSSNTTITSELHLILIIYNTYL